MDLNNYQYLKYIAQTGMPIILSTGMSELDEIHKAVSVIEGRGIETYVYYTVYPFILPKLQRLV